MIMLHHSPPQYTETIIALMAHCSEADLTNLGLQTVLFSNSSEGQQPQVDEDCCLLTKNINVNCTGQWYSEQG